MIQWLVFSLLICGHLSARQSITGWYAGYRDVCQKAASDPEYLEIFRSIPEYRIALEITDGVRFAQYITASDKLVAKIEDFRKLENIGRPTLETYPVLGSFSPTTLRYICLADQIKKMVSLPENAVIAEIGAGFGGQCYILSQLQPFSKYYFFDLPEVESLIGRMMEKLQVKNTHCIPMESALPEEKIDLVISNYAFSECDREIQMEYFDRIIKKADRGYIIYNQISKDCGVDSLTLDEFIQLLKDHGFRPRVNKELFATAPDNMLIIWNRASNRK